MIMATPLKPSPILPVISIYRMKINCAVAKLTYFFYLVDVLRLSPIIMHTTTCVMTSYSDEIFSHAFLLLNT